MTDVSLSIFPVEVVQMIDEKQRPIEAAASIRRPKPTISRGIFSDSAA